jgi:hypothetical protein
MERHGLYDIAGPCQGNDRTLRSTVAFCFSSRAHARTDVGSHSSGTHSPISSFLQGIPLPDLEIAISSLFLRQSAPKGYFVWPALVVDAGACMESSRSDIDNDS